MIINSLTNSESCCCNTEFVGVPKPPIKPMGGLLGYVAGRSCQCIESSDPTALPASGNAFKQMWSTGEN